jgi:lysozyme family protein
MDAEQLYYAYFFLPYRYEELSSQVIANKVFDTGVNLTNILANRFLQESVNLIADKGLAEDGIIGSKSIEVINSLDDDLVDRVLVVFSKLQIEYYAKIVASRADQQQFLQGWLNRANNLN